MKKLIGLIGVLALSATAANAAVIYDANAGSAAGANDALISDTFAHPTAILNVSSADDFILGGDAELTGFTFWATAGIFDGQIIQEIPLADFDFTYNIWEGDLTGNPADATLVTTGDIFSGDYTPAATGYVNYANVPVYTITTDFLPADYVALSGGTTYWLELTAATSPTDIVTWVDHATAPGPTAPVIGDNSRQSVDGGLSYSPLGTDRAFELHGNTVPNPGTLFLIGAGLLGLARRARR